MYTTMDNAVREALKDSKSLGKDFASFLGSNSGIILNAIWRVILLVARIFAGALVIEALAGLNPNLREMIPSLYRITGMLLTIFEKMCAEELKFLGF